jgi:hypothetical protein
VIWTGYDPVSSIDHYDLQWKVGSGSWQNYALDIPATRTSLWVVGQLGQSYAFRLRAADRMGNLSSYPVDAQAMTSIPVIACTTPDGYEPPGNDNTPAAATLLNLGEAQIHNFCNPLSASKGLNDEDWLMISVQAGQRYRFLAFPQVGSAAASLSLYADDGSTLLAQASAQDFDKAIALDWTALQDGLLFLRVRPFNGQVAGNPVYYRINGMQVNFEIRLPVIVP